MASYLRSFFGSQQPNQAPGPDSRKSHSRSQSASTLPQFYPLIGVATSTSSSSSRSRERTNSYLSGTRTTPPSPLRYESGAFRFSRSSSRQPQATHVQSQSSSRAPLSGSSRENVVTYVPFNPTQSFSSTRSTTSSAGYSTKPTRPSPSRTSSSVSVARSDASSEPKPVLKKGRSDSSSSAKSGPRPHVSFENPYRAVSLHMHPLLAYSRLHSAPISYDVTFAPTPQTVVDRSTHTSIPGHTLSQPATDPPTYGELVLHCDKFPWPIIVIASSAPGANHHPLTQNENYPYANGMPHMQRRNSNAVVTNMDVLCALYNTLCARVTPDEWESLGHGSRAQRKATRAYQSRCTKLGGSWEEGVRRVDYLGEKTRLIGVEVDKSVDAAGCGKLVFGKA
ncbi:hypothetical protein BDN72DRAFT_958597 [Pluteus cervinus]|uniref:Uncharacterized protein n=1 Tax=Pluteus cervinus TaxID=181527 RepID=A0ACD3AYR7_9AGAR|nr:hypothetical protein BDN72DRAFT_958597 [Pluteus cervinus]